MFSNGIEALPRCTVTAREIKQGHQHTLLSPHMGFAARAASQPQLTCCDLLTILNRLGYFKFVGFFTWKISFWVKPLKWHSCCLMQGEGDITNYLGICTEPTGDSGLISAELWHECPAGTDRQSLLTARVGTWGCPRHFASISLPDKAYCTLAAWRSRSPDY